MTYPGGKNGAGVYQRIINLMPPHDRYFEPFLGNAAIMRNKLPARVNVGLDLDPSSPGLAWLAGVGVVQDRPAVLDLCCGRGGWAAGFVARGYRVVGVDVKKWRRYGRYGEYPGELRIMDVREVRRENLDVRPTVIVASPPCTEFSKHDQPGLYRDLPAPDMSLVEACFRIARELSAPLVLENVRGLQKFLGAARHHFGSFYFWGDGVPAILPHCPRWTALKGSSGRSATVRALIPEPVSSWVAEYHFPSMLRESGDARSRFEGWRGDGLAFLESTKFTSRDLIYCDPPYLLETRASQRALYDHEFSDVDHRRLLRCLLASPAMVMVSGYWSQLYADELRGWQHVAFQAMTRGGRPATEHLWFNFPAPVALHDYRYLGETFRERERIRRQQRRWCARLQRMNVTQRQALLAAIAGIDVSGEVRS
jgi:SAM-dependent methyltransferase